MTEPTDERPTLTAAGLWQFSLARYAGVETLCLTLQDSIGLNINLLMLCAYCQSEGCALDELQIATLSQHNQAWHQRVIGPYRALRKRLKPQLSDSDYRAMLDIELAMEQEEQQQLFAALPTTLPPGNPEAAANVLICLIQAGAALECLDADALQQLQALGNPHR